MFRIEGKYVNLGAARSIRVDSDTGAVIETAECDQNMTPYQAGMNAQEVLNEAREKAEQIIRDAHIEAADMIISAKEQAEQGRRLAWEEGYTEGAEEGKRSYDEQLSQKLLDSDESLKRVIKEIYDERELTYSKLEGNVVDLALDIVRKIISPAEEAISGVFELLIKNALKQIAPDGKIMLRVSPADYERYFSSGNALFELEGGVKVRASVLRDISLNELDCIIDQENSTVNAGFDTQLKHVQLAFNR